MTETLVREIANEVLLDGLLKNWWTYFVLVSLLAVSGAASAYVSSYLRKRAETFATKADFDELLRQMRATTEAAESVKSAIAKNDWTEREWRTLRRVKLEELMASVHAAIHWLDREIDARLFAEAMPSDASPIWKVEILPELYFPELQSEVSVFNLTFSQYRSWIIDVQAELSSAGKDLAKRQVIFSSKLPEMREMRPKLLLSVSSLASSASKLMKEVAGV